MATSPVPPAVPLAPGSARLAGRLIDFAIVITVQFALRALIDDGFDETEPSFAVALLTLVFVVAYEVGMVATRGGTVGKLALGMRVVDATGASPPSVRTATLRWLPNVVAVVPVVGSVFALALVMASLLWVFTDPTHRSIFDRTGQTFVATSRGTLHDR